MRSAKKLNIKETRKPLLKLWEYKYEDRTTWPYLDCIVAGKEKELYVSKWIKNPTFRFKHLYS